MDIWFFHLEFSKKNAIFVIRVFAKIRQLV